MTTKQITLRFFDLPAHWAVYLINGDASGYDDAEIRTIDGWVERQLDTYPVFECMDVGETSYFTRYYDAPDVGACDVARFTFHTGYEEA